MPLDHLHRAPVPLTGAHALPDIAAHLERLLGHDGGAQLRFRHTSSLGFAAADVVAVELDPDAHVATITASLLGLCGADTPLPGYLADDADRDDEHGAAIRGLLDVIHHRLFSLLLDGLRELDVPARLSPHADDRWSQRLLALLGLPADPRLPASRLVRLAPAFATGVRSPALLAAALRIALADHLGAAAIRVEPWAGDFTPIEPDQWTHLGRDTAILGETAVLGTEVLDPGGAVRLVIGPLGGQQARAFAPGGPAHALLAAVLDRFIPAPLRCTLALDIEDLAYAPSVLGERRLGEDLWLSSGEHTRVRLHHPLA